MITKEQAVAATYGERFHYTGKQQCSRTVGPRGGVTARIVEVRVSGQCKVWKRSERWRLPVKYGLYEHGEINEQNCKDYHRAADCNL